MGRTSDSAPRARVRTPGKHIVLFLAAAAVVVAAAINLMKAAPDNVFRPPASRISDEAIALDPFLVDLAPDRAGRIAYLKLAAVIEPANAEQAAAIDAARDQIAERIVFMLRTMTPEDFEGSDGMERVKAELKRRVDLVMAPDAVRNVVVSDLVIQ